METIAVILMVASVVLPALAILAVIGYVAMLVYSWVKDLRVKREARAVQATETAPRATTKTATATQ